MRYGMLLSWNVRKIDTPEFLEFQKFLSQVTQEFEEFEECGMECCCHGMLERLTLRNFWNSKNSLVRLLKNLRNLRNLRCGMLLSWNVRKIDTPEFLEFQKFLS